MTLYQAQKLHELSEQGYKTLGPADPTVGGGTLVESPAGDKFCVRSDGSLEPAPADARPVATEIA